MDYFGYAYFVERPRRIEDLMVPHPIEKERPFRIVTEIQLPAIDYENFITDMLADRQFIEQAHLLTMTTVILPLRKKKHLFSIHKPEKLLKK